MIQYTVEDLGNDSCRFSVRDQHGRLHVVRAANGLPVLGDTLLGQEAAPGVRLLVHQGTSIPMQVCFEAVGCNQGRALDLLHPMPAPHDEMDSVSSPQPWFGAPVEAPLRQFDPSRVQRSLD